MDNNIINTLKQKYSKKQWEALVKTCNSSLKIIQILVEDAVCDVSISDLIKLLDWSISQDEILKEEQEITDFIMNHKNYG